MLSYYRTIIWIGGATTQAVSRWPVTQELGIDSWRAHVVYLVHNLASWRAFSEYFRFFPANIIQQCSAFILSCHQRYTMYKSFALWKNTLKTSEFSSFFLKFAINLLKPTDYVMHQQFNIQQLYDLPTLYLCVLYLSENKQRLVPLTS